MTQDIELKQKLASCYEYEDFKAVLDFKDKVLDKWRKESGVGDTEFETVKKSMEREFKIKGVEEFFNTLYEMAYNNDARI